MLQYTFYKISHVPQKKVLNICHFLFYFTNKLVMINTIDEYY